MSDTGKTTIRLPDGLWDRFIAFVVKKHGRTHGGVLAKEAAVALEAHMTNDGAVKEVKKVACSHCGHDPFL